MRCFFPTHKVAILWMIVTHHYWLLPPTSPKTIIHLSTTILIYYHPHLHRLSTLPSTITHYKPCTTCYKPPPKLLTTSSHCSHHVLPSTPFLSTSISTALLSIICITLLDLSCCDFTCLSVYFFTGCGTAFDFHKTTDYLFLVGMFLFNFCWHLLVLQICIVCINV